MLCLVYGRNKNYNKYILLSPCSVTKPAKNAPPLSGSQHYSFMFK